MPFARWVRGATLLAATPALVAGSATPPTAPDAEPLPPSSPRPPPGGSSGGGSEGGGVGGPVSAAGRFGGLGGHTASGGVKFRMGEGGGELIFAEDCSRPPCPILTSTSQRSRMRTSPRPASLHPQSQENSPDTTGV